MERSIDEARDRLAGEIMRRDGISGVGVGVEDGAPCLRVYASRSAAGRVPARFDGHRVVVVESGGFRAPPPGGAGAGHPEAGGPEAGGPEAGGPGAPAGRDGGREAGR